jgi:hypothetical protein
MSSVVFLSLCEFISVCVRTVLFVVFVISGCALVIVEVALIVQPML